MPCADRGEPVDQPIAQTTVSQTAARRVVSAAGTQPQTRAEIRKGKNSYDRPAPCRTVPMAPSVDLAVWAGRWPQQRPPAAVPAAPARPLSRPAPAPICPFGAPERPHLSPPSPTTTAAPSTRVDAAAGLRHPYGWPETSLSPPGHQHGTENAHSRAVPAPSPACKRPQKRSAVTATSRPASALADVAASSCGCTVSSRPQGRTVARCVPSSGPAIDLAGPRV